MKSAKFYLAKLIAAVMHAVKKAPPSKPVEKVLLVNTFGLGDVLLSTTCLPVLRKRFPNAHIAFWATPIAAEALRGNPYLDEVVSRDFSFLRPARDFDLALLLTYHPFQTLAVRGIPYRVGYLHGKRVQSNGFPVEQREWSGEHLVHLAAEVALALGCEGPENQPLIFPDEGERERARLLSPEGAFLAVNLQTKIASKSWPLDRMKQIVSWSPIPVALIGGESDREVAAEVQEENPSVINLTGLLSVTETAALLGLCSVFLTADSGPMHLGFAAQAPTVALFGYTDPTQIFLPAPERILLHYPRPCAPHFKVGVKDAHYEECSTRECMTAIGVEEVKSAVLDLLERRASRHSS